MKKEYASEGHDLTNPAPFKNLRIPLPEKLEIDADLTQLFHWILEDVDEIHKLIIELPDIIFTHMHVTPDIISLSPSPLPHEKSRLEQVQEGLAMMAYHETAKRVDKQVFDIEDDEEDSDAPQIQISHEQLNIALCRRNSGDSYPTVYIDKNAWQPFLDTGFTEWRNTRVLFKEIM